MQLRKNETLLTKRAIMFILGPELDKLDGLTSKHRKAIINAGITEAEAEAARSSGKDKTRALAKLDAWKTLRAEL